MWIAAFINQTAHTHTQLIFFFFLIFVLIYTERNIRQEEPTQSPLTRFFFFLIFNKSCPLIFPLLHSYGIVS